jgi:hypothetical protein
MPNPTASPVNFPAVCKTSVWVTPVPQRSQSDFSPCIAEPMATNWHLVDGIVANTNDRCAEDFANFDSKIPGGDITRSMIGDAESAANNVWYGLYRVRRSFGNSNRPAGHARSGALWPARRDIVGGDHDRHNVRHERRPRESRHLRDDRFDSSTSSRRHQRPARLNDNWTDTRATVLPNHITEN